MTPARTRRTQAERTATMRAALLDAAVDAIAELGYRATTTTEVTRRAGVSPGALLHHFPAKADLLTAAVGHAFERRREEFRTAMAGLEPGAGRLGAAIDLLWSMYSGPTFAAYLELWVAARTDPELAQAVVRMSREFMVASEKVFAELFPAEGGFADPAFRRTGLHLAYALLDGLALSRVVDDYEPYPAGEVLAAFKALASLAIAAAQPATTPRRSES